MSRLVLDTSVYSYFRQNHPETVRRIAAASFVYVPTIVLGELEMAFRLGNRSADNRAVLNEFLEEDFVKVLPVTPDVAKNMARYLWN
jgi:predicted nucleic acid-binding protein